jgi:hypothetical protein
VAAAAKSVLPHTVALLCALSTVGCLAPEGDTEESVGTVGQAALTNNALTNNALTNNALTNNALTNNALTNNALTNNALTNNALTNNALTDPNAREVFKYIVSCALPAGQQVDVTVDGVAYSYPGELGLASQWGLNGGICNGACQEWVSACVMARVDYLGEKVLISMRGNTPALAASNAEIAAYPHREGAYYGNIFLATPERNGCIAPGRTGLPRVCGPTTVGCVIEAVGYCDDVCGGADSRDKSFRNCRDNVKDSSNSYPAGTKTYAATATVFLVGP